MNRLTKHFCLAPLIEYCAYRCELGGVCPVGASDWTSWHSIGSGRVFPLRVLVDGIVVHAAKHLFHRTDTLHRPHLWKQQDGKKRVKAWTCGWHSGLVFTGTSYCNSKVLWFHSCNADSLLKYYGVKYGTPIHSCFTTIAAKFIKNARIVFCLMILLPFDCFHYSFCRPNQLIRNIISRLINNEQWQSHSGL